METETRISDKTEMQKKRRQNVQRFLFAPIPLFTMQPILKWIVTYVAKNRPELFARLGTHKDTVYVIEPIDMPFILRLEPNPDQPRLTVHRRREKIEWGAHISGTFSTLMGMVDGRFDGDSLFFTRDLKVEGNTEAVVCLRNAMDDVDGNIMDDVVDACGILSGPARAIVSIVRERTAPR